MNHERMAQRMGIWLMVVAIALACGLPLNHTTLFWVGITVAWVVAGGSND